MLAQYHVGALVRRDFRVILSRLEFEYNGFSWTEEKALLGSVFTVKGSTRAIRVLNNTIRDYRSR